MITEDGVSPVPLRVRRAVVGLAFLGAAMAHPAAAGPQPPHENLHATLWVQSSAEWRALALQAYHCAERALDEALADPAWTAALEQREPYAELPPAVIVDIDETVLDNSYYEAQLIRDQGSYDAATWDPWVLAECATAVPGAVEFLKHAQERGVTVFYVSNRKNHLQAATRKNLASLGFPLATELDTVFTRTDTRDKGPRRAAIAKRYRILLLVGDNNDDFASDFEDQTAAQRRTLTQHYADRWGRQWIAIPNPTYGSWEGAIVDYAFDVPMDQILAKKYAELIFEPGEDQAARTVHRHLGVELRIDETRFWQAPLPTKTAHGFRVAAVDANSPAASAGVIAGDILLEWNGRPIRSVVELAAWVTTAPPPAELRCLRRSVDERGAETWRPIELELTRPGPQRAEF
ncbi:MAG: 5'-nucleotidase, lipoprotein e(P4) family [Planctomycetota bacterium]